MTSSTEFLTVSMPFAGMAHEHLETPYHGHTDNLLLELRHHLHVTDVKINRPVGGHGRDVFNLVFVVLACER